MEKKINNNIARNIAIVIILFGIGLVCFFTTVRNYIDPTLPFSLDVLAKCGDFIGGTLGTLVTLAGILLIIPTIVQQKEMISQQEEMIRKQHLDSSFNAFFEMLKVFKIEQQETRVLIEEIETECLRSPLCSSNYKKNPPNGFLAIYSNILYVYLRDYSLLKSNEPLEIEPFLTSYLRSFDQFIIRIGEEKNIEQKRLLEDTLLFMISDSEFKMMCYYYYMVHDLVYSGNSYENYERKYSVLKSLYGRVKMNGTFRIDIQPWDNGFLKLSLNTIKQYLKAGELTIKDNENYRFETDKSRLKKYCKAVFLVSYKGNDTTQNQGL